MAEISTLLQRFLNVKVSRIINSSSSGRQLHSRTEMEKHRLDVHQHREMLYVFEGESDFLYRDSIWRLTPGTLVAIDEMEPHSYGYSKDDDGLLHLWIHQHPSTITASCLEVKTVRFSTPDLWEIFLIPHQRICFIGGTLYLQTLLKTRYFYRLRQILSRR